MPYNPSTSTWSGATAAWSTYTIAWDGTVRVTGLQGDAEAYNDFSGRAPIGALVFDADAGARFYARVRAGLEFEADAGASFAGRVTEWHVSGLRMDAEAGASFTGHAVGVGTLRCDADAGFEIWPRLRAIPESCLGAVTDAPGEGAGELSNYVY